MNAQLTWGSHYTFCSKQSSIQELTDPLTFHSHRNYFTISQCFTFYQLYNSSQEKMCHVLVSVWMASTLQNSTSSQCWLVSPRFVFLSISVAAHTKKMNLGAAAIWIKCVKTTDYRIQLQGPFLCACENGNIQNIPRLQTYIQSVPLSSPLSQHSFVQSAGRECTVWRRLVSVSPVMVREGKPKQRTY